MGQVLKTDQEVRQWMTPRPTTVGAETTLNDAGRIMHTRHFRQLPVVDGDNQVIGIITDRDVRRVLPSPATALSIWEVPILLETLKVSEVMHQPVICIEESEPLYKAALMLAEHKFGALPVVAQQRLVGILTTTDLLYAFGQSEALERR
jgi:acetoin utilization protein AcuB